jgi:hypothetical protein
MYVWLAWTERRGRVVNTPASYSGGTGFKSRPRDRLSWVRFCGFSQSLQARSGIWPRIWPRPFLYTSFPINRSLITPSSMLMSEILKKLLLWRARRFSSCSYFCFEVIGCRCSYYICLMPWRRKQRVSPKRRLSRPWLRSVATQKITSVTLIALTTSNLVPKVL